MRAQGRGRAHAWCAMACWAKGNMNYRALWRLVIGSTTWREALWCGVVRCGVRCAAVGVQRCGAVWASGAVGAGRGTADGEARAAR